MGTAQDMVTDQDDNPKPSLRGVITKKGFKLLSAKGFKIVVPILNKTNRKSSELICAICANQKTFHNRLNKSFRIFKALLIIVSVQHCERGVLQTFWKLIVVPWFVKFQLLLYGHKCCPKTRVENAPLFHIFYFGKGTFINDIWRFLDFLDLPT